MGRRGELQAGGHPAHGMAAEGRVRPLGCRAPRCQRLSSPLPQAQEWADEKRKAKARKSLLKVSNCSGMGLVCVCTYCCGACG